MTTQGAQPWPTEIKVGKDRRGLTIRFDDGACFSLSAELLRVESPSAEVQGHGGDQKKLVAGKAGVAIRAVEPVGNYAVRLVFDDGHDTGIYSWRTLFDYGRRREELWAAYLRALKKAGLTRSPT